jgi:hypothetical protein
MKMSVETFGRLSLLLGFAALLLTAATNESVAQTPASATAAHTVQANLATFDDLDFNVFSNQKWDQLPRSHAKDILVHWPDGHTTRGIEKHIEDLKAMFVYAPDTRIKVHPVKFGSGEWTRSSSVGEFHPHALTEPDVRLSPHPALTPQHRAECPFASAQTGSDPGAKRATANAPTLAPCVESA